MYHTRPEDDGAHFYLTYYDRKNKRYNAVQLTHLYYKDEKRFWQVDNKLARIEKFKRFETPSGVKRDIYKTNVYGGKIDLNDKENIELLYSTHIPKNQSKRIFNFINKKVKIPKKKESLGNLYT